jgi:hypothetical protein
MNTSAFERRPIARAPDALDERVYKSTRVGE